MKGIRERLVSAAVKGLSDRNECRRQFFRWMAAMLEDRKESRMVMDRIAGWMADYHGTLDCLPAHLTDILVLDMKVYIITDRPGIWIGKGGKVLDSLESHIDMGEGYSVNIIEDMVSAPSMLLSMARWHMDNQY